MAKTIIAPKGGYDVDSYGYAEGVVVNLTLAEMKEMYANNTEITVEYKDFDTGSVNTYQCKPFRYDGMDTFYGYGNASELARSDGVGTPPPHNNEPFCLFIMDSTDSDWHLEILDIVAGVEFYAYVETDEPEPEAPDTATYRWKVGSEKTVIVPEGTYDVPSYGVAEVAANITPADMKELYANNTTATIVYNGVAYQCQPFFYDGMDPSYGYGNASYLHNSDGCGVLPPHNNEPFCLRTLDYESTGWFVDVLDNSSSITVSAYIEGEGQTLVSVGKNDNPLTTLQGGIVNGVFDNARYKLTTPFKLLHDKDWAVEWLSRGACDNGGAMAKLWDESGQQTSSTSECILFRHTTQSISISRFNGSTHIHHGVRLNNYNIEYDAEHVYRLQNKVNADGTNMVWLYVDGEKVAPCTDTFGGETGTSNWVSGKDFSMGYMGVPRYILNGFIMDDISVWESGASEVFVETVAYTITYESAHGTAPASKTVTVNEGESYSLTANDLPIITADGYIFGGWTLNGVLASVGDTISDNSTLVAVWEKADTEFDWDSFVKGYKVGAALRRKRVVG